MYENRKHNYRALHKLKGGKMKIGSLVQDFYGDIGVVIKQIGVVDRWLVHWSNGSVYALYGSSLEVIA